MKARIKLIILFTLVTAALVALTFVNLQQAREIGASPRSALPTNAASAGQGGEIT